MKTKIKFNKYSKYRTHQKDLRSVLYNIVHYKKYWMFFDNDLSRVEILDPTILNLSSMKEQGLLFVVKGFKTPLEFSVYDRIRFRFGFYSTLYACRCVGPELVTQSIYSFINNTPLPTKSVIDEAIENNKFIDIKDDGSERRVKERIRYKRLSDKYSIILHRKIFKLIRKHRVERLEIFV